jgi:hypothetical protein
MLKLSPDHCRGVVKRFGPKNFGFIKRADGTEVYFHHDSGGNFAVNPSSEVYVETGWFVRIQPSRKPQEGDIVFYVEGRDRWNRSRATRWGLKVDYDQFVVAYERQLAEKQQEKIRLEEERLRCNPQFRAIEERIYRDGRREARRGIFAGTKSEFLRNYPLGHAHDPLTSTQFNGVDMRYDRWFERDTADGWALCEDPRTTKLQLTFEQARVLLSGCHFDGLKDRAFGDEEFGWHKDHHEIAYGYYGRREYSVSIRETSIYASTNFEGKLAQQLHDAGGRTHHVDFNDSGDPGPADDVLDPSEVEGFSVEY